MNRAIAYLDEHGEIVNEGYAVRLPPEQLERALYEEVNDVLTRLGGKWNRKQRLHLFPYDVTPAYHAVLSTGILPPKNPTAFFPTPQTLVSEMLELGEVSQGQLVLEPSAGTGAIADALRERGAAVHCCELLDLNRAVLTSKGYELVGDDFLLYNPGPIYDAIVMNPPFSVEGDKTAYITHIKHAWSLLKEYGNLVTIAPMGFEFRSDKKHRDFLDFLCEYGHWSKNDSGAFKASGTGVETAIIWLQKDLSDWRRKPFYGWRSWHSHVTALWADNESQELNERVLRAALQSSGTLTASFREVMSEVVKRGRASGDPINPDDDDLLEVLRHLRGE